MHVMMTMMQRQGNSVPWKGRGERRAEIGEPAIVFQAQKWGDGMSGGGRERERGQISTGRRITAYCVFYVSVGGIACLSVEVEVVARFLFPSHTSNANNVPAPHCHDATPAGAGHI